MELNDAYKILDVAHDADDTIIRKAYKKLALKHHPDKSKGGAKDDFIRINMAYKLLSDKKKRSRYDYLAKSDRDDYFNDVIDCFKKAHPRWYDMVASVLSKLFNDDSSDLNNVFKTAADNIFKEQYDWTDENNIVRVPLDECDIVDANSSVYIYHTVSLLDKYQDNKKLFVIGDKHGTSMVVPLRESEIVYTDYWKHNDKIYDIVVRILISDNNRFKISGDDLVVAAPLTLYQYLYGTEYEYKHIDGEIIPITLPSCIGRPLIMNIKNKGLPYAVDKDDDGYVDITDDMLSVERGDLTIEFYIEGINDICTKNKVYEFT